MIRHPLTKMSAVLAASFALIGMSASTYAEEQARPWGRLPQKYFDGKQNGNSEQRGSGYLGRYNPWGFESKGETSEEPRYWERNTKPLPRRDELPEPKYPMPYYPVPGYLPPAKYYDYLERDRKQEKEPSTEQYPGLSPWGGVGYSPYYGNYWSDPFGSVSPYDDTMWPDMWRW